MSYYKELEFPGGKTFKVGGMPLCSSEDDYEKKFPVPDLNGKFALQFTKISGTRYPKST